MALLTVKSQFAVTKWAARFWTRSSFSVFSIRIPCLTRIFKDWPNVSHVQRFLQLRWGMLEVSPKIVKQAFRCGREERTFTDSVSTDLAGYCIGSRHWLFVSLNRGLQ